MTHALATQPIVIKVGGALLDSEILAEVYLQLIGGRQPDFGLAHVADSSGAGEATAWRPSPRPTKLKPRLTEKERAAHDSFVKNLSGPTMWQ